MPDPCISAACASTSFISVGDTREPHEQLSVFDRFQSDDFNLLSTLPIYLNYDGFVPRNHIAGEDSQTYPHTILGRHMMLMIHRCSAFVCLPDAFPAGGGGSNFQPPNLQKSDSSISPLPSGYEDIFQCRPRTKNTIRGLLNRSRSLSPIYP